MHIFRPPQKKDTPDIAILLCQLVADPAKFNNFADFQVEPLIENPHCHCLVVEHQKKIVGFGALITFLTPVHGIKGRIEDIVIHENHRGKGLGKKLVQELIAIAKRKNIKNIHLTSNPKREIARKLYSSLGFKLHDTGVFVFEMED